MAVPMLRGQIRVGLLGDGGMAQEVAEYLPVGSILFRAVSAEFMVKPRLDLIDLNTSQLKYLNVAVVAAVGGPAARRTVVSAWAGDVFATIRAEGAWISRGARIGQGSIIAPGAIVTSGTVIHEHVILNVGASVSHDCEVGDYVTISPGARIAGRCSIGTGAFLGIGSTVSNGVTIAEGTVVGAGSTVIANTEPNGVYVGVPARQISLRKDWLYEI